MQCRLWLSAIAFSVFIAADTFGQPNWETKHPPGTLILSGGGSAGGVGDRLVRALKGGETADPVVQRFVEAAGGPEATFVVIQVPNSRASKDDQPRNVDDAIVSDPRLAAAFGVKKMTALRVVSRDISNDEKFAAPLRTAKGVWITGGNLNVLVDACRDTLTQRELQAVLDRGGVVGGESAGAIIQTSHISKNIKGSGAGKPDTDCYEGFGFLQGVVIVPHLIRMGWENNLVPVIAANPKLLGIGIDEGTAVVVQEGFLEVIGSSKVAIYDDLDHGGKRYFFLSPGDRFDLAARKPESRRN